MIKREQKTVKLSEIKPNPDNPRVIKRNQLKSLQKSLNDFPEMMKLRPIVVDEDGMILGGNMRYQALLENGATETEVETVSGLTPEQKREFVIKDNVAFGDWDWDKLANEFEAEQLNDWGLDVKDLSEGFQALAQIEAPFKELSGETNYDVDKMYRGNYYGGLDGDVAKEIDDGVQNGQIHEWLGKLMKVRIMQSERFNFDELAKFYRSDDASEAERDLMRRLVLVYIAPKEAFERALLGYEKATGEIYDAERDNNLD